MDSGLIFVPYIATMTFSKAKAFNAIRRTFAVAENPINSFTLRNCTIRVYKQSISVIPDDPHHFSYSASRADGKIHWDAGRTPEEEICREVERIFRCMPLA